MNALRGLCVTFVLVISLLGVGGCGSSPPPADDDAGSGTDAGGCRSDAECDDGAFCNGVERCDEGVCRTGTSPCAAGQSCDEGSETCTTECSVEPDADGDGSDATECGGDDCDDSDPRVHPGATELCDLEGVDEDCDPTSYGERDIDGDGDDDAICCNGEGTPDEACGLDCNDLARGVNPGSPEVCNGYDDDCDGLIDEGVLVASWPDTDFDLHGDASAATSMRCAGAHGYATVGDDCDDTRPDVHPAQVEICDRVDNDCDGRTDEAPVATTWYLDADDDGFGSPNPATTRVSCEPLRGYSLRPTDCDDTRRGISPAASEQCNGLDDDCDGAADFSIGPGDGEDDDLDGHADVSCPRGDDCDDRDPLTATGQHEWCDGRDNDCNGIVDDGTAMGIWYRDADGDTFGDESQPTLMSCDFVVGYIPRGGDCDDSDPDDRPSAPEACNGDDDDCDGDIDEGAARQAYYSDLDFDGLGAGVPVLACTMPSGRVLDGSDCDDASASIRAPRSWYPDFDEDGAGDADAAPMLACTAPLRHVTSATDCDDAAADVSPSATERCNGLDDDCDGTVDDGADAACSLANASAVCTGGACELASCTVGFDDCDSMVATGCETDVRADAANCGACGTMCAAGQVCRASTCTGVAQLVSGDDFFCARLADGEVHCWGPNGVGQCARGTTSSPAAPGRVLLFTSLPLDDATMISAHAGSDHACAIRADRSVVCWGSNSHGQVGPDGGANALRAVPIPGITDAVHVDVGERHTCAVLASGGVRCWGQNDGGQLGSGATSTTEPMPRVMVENDGMGGTRPIADATQVSCGADFTCVLHTSGRVSCAGRDNGGPGGSGALGRGTGLFTPQPVAAPVALPVGSVVTALSSGGSHTCALRASGRPICWGLGQNGQLTAGQVDRPTPTEVDLVLASTQEIATGWQYTCFRYTHPAFGARVACAGFDGDGVLGDGTATGGAGDSTPDDVVASADGETPLTGATQVAAGTSSVCVVLATGRVACWGRNEFNVFGAATPSLRAWCDTSAPVPNVP